jgi:hypothetical protein
MGSIRWIAAVSLTVVMAACSTPSTVLPPPDDSIGGNQPVVYVPGQSYYGDNRYIEYIAGDLPIILSASHGGDLAPAGIPDRTAARCGGSATTVTDWNTRELTLAMRAALVDRFGGHPHVVINHLRRTKLDANRGLLEAACGNASAGRAWSEYHAFLESARAAVVEAHGRGWYMDIHGHGHANQRLELGYLLSRSELNLSDDALDADDGYRRKSSIQTLAASAGIPFSRLLRGDMSLGSLYADHGYPSIPSATDPAPHDDPFFTGGYNTFRYACSDRAASYGGVASGPICGVQVEANRLGVRENAEQWARFAEATAAILEQYLATHLSLELVRAFQ